MNDYISPSSLEKVMGELESEPIINMGKHNFQLLTLEQILNQPTIIDEWVVEGIILKHGLIILSGLPFHGKSLFAQELIKAVASGQLFLNHFKTIQGAILVIDREIPTQRLKKRWSAISADANLPIYFYPYNESFKLDNQDDAENIKQLVKKHNIQLVVIDTLNRCHSGKELNSYDQVAQIFNPLKELLTDTSIIAIHHSNKSGYKSATPTAEELLGSTDFAAEPDVIFTLRKTEDTKIKVFNLKSRDSELLRPFELNFTIEADGKVDLQYQGEIITEDTPATLREKAILSALSEGKMMKSVLITKMRDLGHSEGTVSNTLTALRKAKRINSEQIGQEAAYFLLDKNHQPEPFTVPTVWDYGNDETNTNGLL